ncbi:MAG: hypothetical protein V3R96_03120 [Dehalococcoidales bacterium]
MDAGDRIRVTGGEHEGKTGKVIKGETIIFKGCGTIEVDDYGRPIEFTDGSLEIIEESLLEIVN